MKKYILPLAGGLLLLVQVAQAAWETKEMPIQRSGKAITVSISTSAWTIANTTASKVENRAGFRVTNPASNTAAMYAVCHSTTPAEAITVKVNEIGRGVNITMPCGNAMNLYLLSVHTSTESAHVWEFGQ